MSICVALNLPHIKRQYCCSFVMTMLWSACQSTAVEPGRGCLACASTLSEPLLIRCKHPAVCLVWHVQAFRLEGCRSGEGLENPLAWKAEPSHLG